MASKSGLSVSVYKSGASDCTNGGVSSYLEDFVLVGPGVDGPFEPDEGNALMVVPGPYNSLQAVSAFWSVVDERYKPVDGPAGEVGPMFGGNFIYTSDSRFPYDFPVKVFDRFEAAERRMGA